MAMATRDPEEWLEAARTAFTARGTATPNDFRLDFFIRLNIPRGLVVAQFGFLANSVVRELCKDKNIESI